VASNIAIAVDNARLAFRETHFALYPFRGGLVLPDPGGRLARLAGAMR
jgi:hypothetical protein